MKNNKIKNDDEVKVTPQVGSNSKVIRLKDKPNSTHRVGRYTVDTEFCNHFKNLKQVFIYITDRCNNFCEQCIYKPSVNKYLNPEIELSEALDLLKTFRDLGASKVTFLGGEPTLYGLEDNNQPLLDLIDSTRQIGYKYIRLDTNGLAINHLYGMTEFQELDEIAFSLDGYTADMNDRLRGAGSFKKIIRSIKDSISQGYNATITCCAHQQLLEKDHNSTYNIEMMIRFAESLGVSQINFHDLFKTGVPMDTWTGEFSPTPDEWVVMYEEISKKVQNRSFDVGVRLPQCFVTAELFSLKSQYYGYCPAKLGERVMVHPNGIIRICSNMICTSIGTAKYKGLRIMWDSSNNNELQDHDYEKDTPCTNRSRHRKYGNLVPLCFSFKPEQNEYVWKSELCWDNLK